MPAPEEVFSALHRHFLCLADVGLRLVGPEAAGPGVGEQAILAAAVSRDPEAERELCARAMAALYHSHAGAIGEWHTVAGSYPGILPPFICNFLEIWCGRKRSKQVQGAPQCSKIYSHDGHISL